MAHDAFLESTLSSTLKVKGLEGAIIIISLGAENHKTETGEPKSDKVT